MEAHVQVRYQGDPDRFAWLVPLPARPEVSIGSQPLFDALLDGSAPVFGVRTHVMHCDGGTTTSEAQGCASEQLGAPDAAVPTAGEEQGAMLDPIGETVGSFDVTLLDPSDVDVLQWLQESGFEPPEGTAELVAPYVREGAIFAALRLSPGAGVREIHPVVFRYRGERAAIPLRLTAVAATRDMRIRAFFLDAGRAVPSNYRHVVLNPVRLHWPTFASNYEAVLSAAIDETGDGMGFATEYAGSSAVIDAARVHDERWDGSVFLHRSAERVVSELEAQGLAECGQQGCRFLHPLVAPLLRAHLPMPEGLTGVDEARFYACIECFTEAGDTDGFDPAAFMLDFEQRIEQPGLRARELLESRPYLTRLVTTLSPDEMRIDPAFHVRDDLPAVQRERWAERVVPCDGAARLELEGGRLLPDARVGQGWVGNRAGMPSAERIELVPRQGPVELVRDASAEIDRRLEGVAAEPAGDAPRAGCRVHPGISAQGLWLGLAVLLLWRRRRRPYLLAGSQGQPGHGEGARALAELEGAPAADRRG